VGCIPGREFEAVKDVALRCEALGFDSIWSYDHFITYPATSAACLESWTILSVLATLTKNVGLGQLVTCNSYRYPSVLAKMGATLDVISKGRLNFGVGAGWYKLEYDAYGARAKIQPNTPTSMRPLLSLIGFTILISPGS
jgi:alkanesulfonate monooxygenase SsuD/methylene tetrahydromethanopterin reductase-like flavin-dependent oxidoreductase (luciferase family)